MLLNNSPIPKSKNNNLNFQQPKHPSNDNLHSTNGNVLNEIFEQSLSNSPIPINNANDDKIALRKLRNAAKKQHKAQIMQKTKTIYNIVLPKTEELKGDEILKLRYSQDSIDGKTGDGSMTVDELAKNMSTQGWKKGTQITVINMPDDEPVSANNRRLFAAKKVAEKNKEFALTANIFEHDDKAPIKFIRGIEAEFMKGRQITATDMTNLVFPESILSDTYGSAMVLRINTRGGDLANSHFGYKENPTVRE